MNMLEARAFADLPGECGKALPLFAPRRETSITAGLDLGHEFFP